MTGYSPTVRPGLCDAQSRWSVLPVRRRLEFVRFLRHLIAENGDSLACLAASIGGRPVAEKLASEVLPLADACRWLERNAVRILAPRRYGRRGRPLWLSGAEFEVQRQALGKVLVISPGNYPLFLPAVHGLHALVAGNSVQLKPAPGTRPVALAFARLAFEAGLDPTLLEVLEEDPEAAQHAIVAGVDKVVFTGSSENGRAVLAQLANSNTPAVMELSGQDPVVVLADADLDLVVRALHFGSRLNGGETCIAPRRVIVVEPVLAAFVERFRGTPILLEYATDAESAIALVNAGRHGLGAAIFTRDVSYARAIASRIKTGFVTINDVIVPTADPRMPFGGVKASGFGMTRGSEGLLEMTFPHVVSTRRGMRRPHFGEPTPDDARLFSAYLRAAHGRRGLAALPGLVRAIFARIKNTSSS